MTIQRMEYVGIVVDDLEAATAFFLGPGLTLQGEGQVEGGWVDRVVGLEGVRVEYAMVETPDGHYTMNALPDFFLQSAQWQRPTCTGSPRTL
jgi:hypothetical protein